MKTGEKNKRICLLVKYITEYNTILHSKEEGLKYITMLCKFEINEYTKIDSNINSNHMSTIDKIWAGVDSLRLKDINIALNITDEEWYTSNKIGLRK